MGKSGAGSTNTSPPAGTGTVAGMGELFSLDLNSGQGTYSLPFELPEGVAGFRPTVKLEYRHSNGGGPFGLGWRLELRQIDRRLDLGVPGSGVEEVYLDSGVELRASAGGGFHPVRESAFSHYSLNGDHWVVTERDGSRYFFGLTASARVADPDHPDRIQSWLLERHEDVNGNAIQYVYTTQDGYSYLSEIRYAKFVVRFEYEARPDILINGRAGFVRQITQRCRAIRLHLAADNRAVRTLALSYSSAPLSNVSLLVAAQLTAHGDGQPDVVKNPMTFGYSTFDGQQIDVGWINSRRGDPLPPPLTDPDTALLALDDLPLPGILVNRNGRQTYWPNNGQGGWDFPRRLQEAPYSSSFQAEGVQFIDMDGTGSADMLVGIGGNPLNGYYENQGADGFGRFAAYPRQARTLPPFETGRVRLGELDGDGIVDACYSTRRGLISYRNSGRQGWSEPTIAANAGQVNFADPLTFLADMTGDGLPDLVRVRSGQVEYWVNLGLGRFGERMVMERSPRLAGIIDDPGQLLLVDVDGDGCSDLVRVSAAGIELYVNQSGQGFAAPVIYPAVPIPIPGTVRAADMSGRAAAGVLYNSRRAGQTGYVRFAWDQDTPPYLLERVDNGNGLVTDIEHEPLVEMARADRDQGRLWNTYMPFPIWVVSATRETDTVRGRTQEVRYRYHDGHYDPLFRHFQGFGQVERTEVGDESRADVLTKYTFLMDQSAVPGNSREHAHLDRMLARAEVYSLDGSALEDRPYRIEETDYDVRVLETLPDGTNRVFVSVHSTRKRYRERTHDERVEERTFDYDAFGNVVREVTRGFGTRNGAPVPEKQITTDVLYATDASQRIFKIAQTVKRDDAGQIVMEMRRMYDGLPLGHLSRGLMTREEHLVLPLAEFNAHYAGMNMAALGYLQQADAGGNPAVFALEIRKTYTPEGNVASETTGGGRATVKTYDADNLYVVQETVNGKTSRRVNEAVTGKPLELIAASGARTRMEYDAFGRITAFMVANDTPANPTRGLVYDDASVPNSVTTRYRIDTNNAARTVAYYDGAAKEVQKRIERSAGEVVVSGWLDQNPWRQTKAEFEPTLDSSLAFARPSTAGRPAQRTSFDGEGRPVGTVNYNGGVSSAQFTPFEIITRDANDNDAGHAAFDTPRREEVDVWNHRSAVHEIGAGGALLTTQFTVGLFGELLQLADASGPIATYRYDMRGNQLSVDHRDAGRREEWYDSHNEIVRTRDARGHDVTVQRDGEGRITQVELNGAVVEQFTYDDVTPGADGRLADAQYPGGRQQFTYSPRGFLAQHRVTTGAQVFDLGYEYNDMGRQTAIVYPDGTRLTRLHTNNGLVRRIDGIVDAIQYDARNLATRIDFANGVTTTINYEAGAGKVQSQRTVAPNGTVMEDVTFDYDDLMQLTGRSDTAPGAVHSAAYTYDPLNQLKRVDSTDPAGNVVLDYTYSNGYNLAQVGESGWQLGYGEAGRPDRLTDVTEPAQPVFNVSYDANGNLTALPNRQMAFNFKNQLEQVTLDNGTVVRYDYDYRGNRVRRQVTRVGVMSETFYLGRLVEFSGGQFTNFAILDRRRIAQMRNGQTRWLHLDPLGSANFFSDENGLKIAQIAYHPFGVERSRTGVPPQRIYALHDLDDETGLIYMGHRWYAPEIGRFITPDPLYLYRPERSDGDPVKLRLYTYVGNHPLDRVDPVGLSFWSVFGAIVGVIVGIVLAIAVVAACATGVGLGILAIIGVIALVTVSYVVAANNQGTALGEFFRGFMIGLNAGLNATFLAMMGPVGAFLGGFVGTLIFLSAFDTIASNEIFQGILGWSNWLMPMSWLVIGLGAIMWILNGLGHLILWEIPNLWGGGVEFFRITDFRMDWSTGMLATRGGWVANANMWDTAFNMGNFSYVDANSTGWHMDHEAGHNLSLATFGSIFHFVGFFHEMGVGRTAFSEVLADSNDGGPGMWHT
jgi:RHS repeat-associated protein